MERMVNGPTFDREWETLMSMLTAHMEKEERVDFNLLKARVSLEDRVSYGKKFANRKMMGPTRPHPSVPESPATLEEAMGMLAAPIDRFRDLFREYPETK